MRINRTIVPFKGKLQTLIAKRFGHSIKLTDREKAEIASKREDDIENAPLTRRVRRKELDGLFRVYANLCSLDEFVFQTLGKTVRLTDKALAKGDDSGIDVCVGLVSRFEDGVRYLRQKFPDEMNENFVQSASKIHKNLVDLEVIIKRLVLDRTPIEHRISQLRDFVRRPVFKDKALGEFAEIMKDIFKIMAIPVSVRDKRNSTLNIPYVQFALSTPLESALSKASHSVVEELEKNKRSAEINRLQLEEDLQNQGYIVRKVRDVFKTKDASGVSYATVAYRPQIITDLGQPPKKPTAKTHPDPAARAEAIREYEEDLADYTQKSLKYVEGIYSPKLRSQKGDEYERYTNFDDYRDAMANQVARTRIFGALMPEVQTLKKNTGNFVTVENKDGTTTQEPIFEHLTEITFKDKAKNRYLVPRYDLSEAFGDPNFVQMTDAAGQSKNSLTRVVKTRKIIVNEREMDIIVEGTYKGMLADDLINTTGRLIEGSYFIKGNDGKRKEIQLIDDVYVLSNPSDKKSVKKTSLKEVSFLEIGGKTDSGYQKVLSNRLREPYITLSLDKTHLVLGIPSTEAHTLDRNKMKELAKIMPGITQRKDARLSSGTAGLNPFYMLDAPSYEAVRDTLGSVSLSKGALEFLENYYKELTARDRALNEENVNRFTASEIGGFVEEVNGRRFEFNNKQKEAMAWLEANAYSGLMALDTGVGKTLLAGGAMNHYIRHKEAKGADTRFLFVSPKRLQGNFTREMTTYLKDKSLISTRVEEMNYNKFTLIARGIETLDETMKLPADQKAKKLAVLPPDFWKDPKGLKGPKFKTASEYFSSKYAMCFFDEVNEALTGAKKKAISELKHPRKILLTASSMEKDPLDLYRFVAIAKGDNVSKEKERGFAERFGNVLGNRFVGLKEGAPVRSEFYTWVKANAYFADKQDVNLEDIGLPKLLVPTEQVVSIRMEPAVQKEYRKVANTLSREMKGMVRKYRDILTRGKKSRTGEFGEGKAALQDFAITSLKKIQDLITLSTNPGKYFDDKDYPNPKLEEATKILLDRPGQSICYFSADPAVVKANAIKCSNSGVGGVHAALLDNRIEFYRAGKSIGAIQKKTGRTKIQELDRLMRTASAPIDYSFIKNSKTREDVRDFKELVEFNIEKYSDVLEEDEFKEISTSYESFLKALRDRNTTRVRETRRSLDTKYFKIFDFDADQWAINATKAVFNNNPNIKSISCTDAYAKGFNFQFISTVVHLDRGEGFDSELVKQRTARAYRTGQEKQVEVLYLDSMLDTTKPVEVEGEGEEAVPYASYEDVSLDEIKNIVQKADQTFFKDIIEESSKISLVENYERVKRTSGKLVSMNRNLFSMILSPTAKVLSEAQSALADEDRNPLKTSSLASKRFTENDTFKRAILASAGGSDGEEIRKTCDLTGLSAIADYQFDKKSSAALSKNAITTSGSLVAMSAKISKDKKTGGVTVHTSNLNVARCAPKGIGSRLIFAQITAALVNKEVKVITADSTGDHMLLPRLGFDKVITLNFLQLADDMISEDEKFIKNWLIEKDRVIKGAKTHLSDLFLCTDSSGVLVGQKWWKENGQSLTGLTLSLNENGTSMRLLNIYFKAKCASLNTTPSDYLTAAFEPFDVDDPACWIDHLKGYGENADITQLITYVNAYKTPFKNAYYSSEEVRRLTPEGIKTRHRLKDSGFEKLVDPSYPATLSGMEDPFKQSNDPILDEAWKAISKNATKSSLLKDSAADRGDFMAIDKIEAQSEIKPTLTETANADVVAPSENEVDLGTETAVDDMLAEPPSENIAQIDLEEADKSVPTPANETEVSFTDEDGDFDIYALDDEEV